MRWLAPVLCSTLALTPACAWAVKTNYSEPHSGLSFGGGTYTHPFTRYNFYDPLPALAGTGTTLTGNTAYHLLPLRFGYFKDIRRAVAEIYVRGMINTAANFSASGTLNGTGQIYFRSFGVGSQLTAIMWQTTHLRLGLAFNGEVVFQNARISSLQSGGSAQEALEVGTRSLLAGVGLQPEVWLGDLWSLSLFAGYQYGWNSFYSVSKAGTFLGQTVATGSLIDPATGAAKTAQFGGVLAEAIFRLNFR